VNDASELLGVAVLLAMVVGSPLLFGALLYIANPAAKGVVKATKVKGGWNVRIVDAGRA
jgi:hypothetical protein